MLCSECNSKTGGTWDAALAAQLNPLSLLVGVTRHRGTPPSQTFETLGGGALELHHDGSLSPAAPLYREDSTAESVRIQITARTMREMRQMLQGVKRKYPKVDIDELAQRLQPRCEYPAEPMKIPLSFGGEIAGRSIVKSALCFAVASGVELEACIDARAYLKDQNAEPCFGYYYTRDLVADRTRGVPLHCVAVSSRRAYGQLLAYVEFFGAQRAVVRLARHYDGPEIHCTYAIDPRSAEELIVDVDLSLSSAEIAATYAYDRIPPGSIEEAFKDVLDLALTRSREREHQRAISEAIEYAWRHCGAVEGESLTAAHMDTIVRLAMTRLEPYLLHRLVNRRG